MRADPWRRHLTITGASAVVAAVCGSATASADVAPWVSASASGDSRGALVLDARAGVALDGLNCRFIDGEAGVRLGNTGSGAADGGLAGSLDERVTVCPWEYGFLDLSFDQALSWQVEPRLTDRYGLARQRYTRTSWAVSLSLFDFLNLRDIDRSVADGDSDGGGDDDDLAALGELFSTRDERVLFLPFTIRTTRTTQDAFELREVQVTVTSLRWWKAQPGGGRRTLDILPVEIRGVEENGTGVGVALGTIHLGKLSGLRLGDHLELDAELGWVGAGTMGGSSGRIDTPDPLYGTSEPIGKLGLSAAWSRVGVGVSAERSLDPTMALGLAVDERALGVVRVALGDTTVTLSGFAARTENHAADGSRFTDATYGGGATVAYALPNDFALEVSAEAAQSFYPVLDGRPVEAAPAARAMVSLRFDLGERPH